VRYKTIKTRLYLSKSDQLFIKILFRASKSLYNQALYNVRQHFFETGEYLHYEENYHLLKNSEHYKMLNTSMAQGVIMKIDEAMKAFFGSLKSNKVQKVRLPRYLSKYGYYPLIDRMVYKPHNEFYVLPRSNFIKHTSKLFHLHKKEQLIIDSLKFSNILTELRITIETPKCILQKPIKEITIKPMFDGQYIEVIHTYIEEDVKEEIDMNKTETMGIDLGYDNLTMCAVTTGNHLLIDGRRLKSFNQWYHKRMAYLQKTRTLSKSRVKDIQDTNDCNETTRKKKVVLPYTKNMMALEVKRNNRMNYGINKAARLILTHALENNVGEIIIGWNKNFKQKNLGKKTNQWFKNIPLARLRDRINYLCEEHNIKCTIITEEYTSKASYLDNDEIPTNYRRSTIFSGKRAKRGLYITRQGIKINADLNAALNIVRKGKPEAKRLGVSGVNTPKRTLLF
jgi:IS605 OrfB family transposase